jgi:hypothetical protein
MVFIFYTSIFIAALEYPEASFGDESAIPYATKYPVAYCGVFY